MSAPSQSDFSNLVEMFLWRSSRSADQPALWCKQSGRYDFLTWQEFAARVRHAALALHHQGVRSGDRAGILSENRPEWATVDLGILSLGAVTVPIYPTSSVKECLYILEHAGVSVLFVSSREQFDKVSPFLGKGSLKSLIVFDALENLPDGIVSFQKWLDRGRWNHLNNGDFFAQQVRRVTREDLATLIYTSGTTGPPKGVMLTHGNFLSNCEATAEVLQMEEGLRSLSFLPLSHVFERMAGNYFMMLQGASIAYAENMQTVPEDLLLVRPSVACSVPRFYEKMHARILEVVHKGSRLRQAIFHWALKVGREAALCRAARKPLSVPLGAAFTLARLLVFKKLKGRLGGRIRYFISGGAPLGKELAEFFFAAEVLILEGYGLTETSPVISVNRPEKFKFGTVGLPLPGVEVRIAEDGEVLTRGPHVMKGYYKNEEATREAIRDGWFHTGDLGELDPEGFLVITGRKKDIIVTAGGKNISPQNLENEILKDPLFSQVVVIGDRRPYLVALIAPQRPELERVAREAGTRWASWEDLLRSEGIRQLMARHLARQTRDFARYEQVRYFEFLPRELTQEAGELTPTLKIKRRVVMERYAPMIEALYQKGEAYEKSGVP